MSDQGNAPQSPIPPEGWEPNNETPAQVPDQQVQAETASFAAQSAGPASAAQQPTEPVSATAQQAATTTAPFEAQASQQATTESFEAQATQQATTEPFAAQAAGAGAGATAVKKKGAFQWKTFLVAFAGAALACVLALGIYTAVHPSSSTVIGSDGSGTTITVNGEDTTLSEAVAAKCLSSVVNIDVYTSTSSVYGMMGITDSSSSSSETLSSLGSGVILSSDGYILTNYHVIEDADSLKVTANGTEYEATVVGTDASSDLAVIKIDATDLTAIEVGSSSDLTVGEWVMAIGSPYGYEQSVSTGIVSGTGRTANVSSSTAVYTNMIQTDAAINSGNSGGALVDSDGKLIGINTLIASSSGSGSGVGFAIPVDYAISIAEQLINGETPTHAQMGVTTTTITSDMAARYGLSAESGAYVTSVTSGSGAESAGIQEGDIITSVDGEAVTSSSELVIAVRSHNAGDVVSVTYVRDGSESTVDVTLGSDA